MSTTDSIKDINILIPGGGIHKPILTRGNLKAVKRDGKKRVGFTRRFGGRLYDQKRFEYWAAYSFLQIFNGLFHTDYMPFVNEIPDLLAVSWHDKNKKIGIEVAELSNINRFGEKFIKTDDGVFGSNELFAALKHIFDKKLANDYRQGFPVFLLIVNRFYICAPHDINHYFFGRYKIPSHHFEKIFFLTPRIRNGKAEHNISQLFELKNSRLIKFGELVRKLSKKIT